MEVVGLFRHFFVNRPRLQMSLKNQIFFSPTLIQLVIIRKCNLNCAYCNEYDKVSNPVSLDAIKQRIDKAEELGTLSIEFTGGEPLLHPNLSEIVSYATGKGFPARMLISNAYLFNEEHIKRLNDAGLTHLQVSVDGVTPNRMTVKVLDRLRHKLELLAKLAKFRVQLSAVIGAASAEEVLEVVDFAKAHGFRPRALILHGEHGQINLSREQRSTYDEVKRKIGHRFRESHNYREKLIRDEPAPFKCRAGARYIYVDDLGQARYCSQHREIWSKTFLDLTSDDLKNNFYTKKPCNAFCTVGCARTNSAFDEWRIQH